MRMIKVTSYDACLTAEPIPVEHLVNPEQISVLTTLTEGWTSVWFGGGPLNIHMKGTQQEVMAQLGMSMEDYR